MTWLKSSRQDSEDNGEDHQLDVRIAEDESFTWASRKWHQKGTRNILKASPLMAGMVDSQKLILRAF